MKLSVKGFTWGGAFGFLLFYVYVGIVNIFSSGYGAEYFSMVQSLYPGYAGTWANVTEVILGGVYFFVGGLICGFVIAFFINLFTGKGKKKKAAPKRAATKRPAAKKKKTAAKKKPAAKKKKTAAKKKPAAKKKKTAAKKKPAKKR
jgi:hypothetical protein